MKIIICGGRDFNDYILMEEIFEQVSSQNNFKNIEIVCGMAKGADRLGEELAKNKGFKIKYFPANWDLHGKSAGYHRNVEMAKYILEDGMVLAFWNRRSQGTKHMIDTAKKLKIDTIIIDY